MTSHLLRTIGLLGATLLVGSICACTTPAEPRSDPIVEAKASQPKPSPMPGKHHPLQPLFRALAALETGDAKEPVSIVQLGDSHTAGDFLSGHMRELFQQRFGRAGRGLLPPGLADKYYDPHLVVIEERGEWERSSLRAPDAPGPFGIAGVTQSAARPRQADLISDEAEGFDHVFLEFLRRPGGGSFRLAADAAPPTTIQTAATDTAPDWLELAVPQGSHRLTLNTVGDGNVTILAWGSERRHPGVLYQNFGVIGAKAEAIGRLDPRILKLEMAHVRPAMILVAYGTNEAFGNAADLDHYQEDFTARVKEIQAAAPDAAIVIIGPPDVEKEYAAGNADGRTCARVPRKGKKAKRSVWARPHQLDLVLNAERAAAKREGWYFWDWSRAMGGACAMQRWASSEPPRGRPDHVHMTIAGYDSTADMLFADLMEQYDASRKSR